MKELSLNILDVAENSVKAKANLTSIILEESEDTLSLSIEDDGTGMDETMLQAVTDPFFTTRTTRNVGLGVPLLKLAAEQTGGSFEIQSSTGQNHGTKVTAKFIKTHIDFTPLGDVVSTITTLIQGHPETDFYFCHTLDGKSVELDTRQIRQVLGDDIPLDTYDVIKWIEGSLIEQYS